MFNLDVIGSISLNVSFVFYLILYLPQIFKNRNLRSTKALNSSFLWINLSLALMDMVSAWCLDWGWPNKITSPVTALIGMILLSQNRKYRHDSFTFHKEKWHESFFYQ